MQGVPEINSVLSIYPHRNGKFIVYKYFLVVLIILYHTLNYRQEDTSEMVKLL